MALRKDTVRTFQPDLGVFTDLCLTDLIHDTHVPYREVKPGKKDLSDFMTGMPVVCKLTEKRQSLLW